VILTKPLGVGIYSAAIKKDMLPPEDYTEMIATTTLLNRVGAKLAKDSAVHAITGVTGFGLLGHGLEMARGSNATLVVDMRSLPLLKDAAALSQQGCVTGASRRNWASYCENVSLPNSLPDWQRHLLTDPQTSGGLLVSCVPDRAEHIRKLIVGDGYPFAGIVGRIEVGPAMIRVESGG
jgi:selenide,water dikinase